MTFPMNLISARFLQVSSVCELAPKKKKRRVTVSACFQRSMNHLEVIHKTLFLCRDNLYKSGDINNNIYIFLKKPAELVLDLFINHKRRSQMNVWQVRLSCDVALTVVFLICNASLYCLTNNNSSTDSTVAVCNHKLTSRCQ